jgi:carbon monoxide dehydrogenase subunit G
MSLPRLIAAAVLVLPGLAFAHGPTRQKADEAIEIAAPPDKVWAIVKDFGGAHRWVPGVAATALNGTTRVLKLDAGGQVVEELETIDDANMSLRFRMKDPGPVPVNNFSAQISVSSSGSGSLVRWRGAFYRAYLNNDPPPEQSDEAAVKAITGMFKGGLEKLKKVAEGK